MKKEKGFKKLIILNKKEKINKKLLEQEINEEKPVNLKRKQTQQIRSKKPLYNRTVFTLKQTPIKPQITTVKRKSSNMEELRKLTELEESLLSQNKCPNCETLGWMVSGPSAGICKNWRCIACGHRINLCKTEGIIYIQVIDKGIIVNKNESKESGVNKQQDAAKTEQQELITQDIHGINLGPGHFYWVLLEENDKMYYWENMLVPARYAGDNKWHLLADGGEEEEATSTWPVIWVGERITPSAINYKDNDLARERIRKYKRPEPLNAQESRVNYLKPDLVIPDLHKHNRITMEEPPGFFERIRLWLNKTISK